MNSFNCIGNGIAKKRNVSQNFLVASTDTATITYKGYETHNLLQTVTPSFNINIKFDILYRGGGINIFA